ncbi:MAG: hypothetical protein DSZ28_09920 [Thiothrix sp.]|nr:MAG: hypothetical protein DSZ28_09920 [Thiothrix sp.]
MHKVRKDIAPMAFRILGINSGINRMADFFGQNAFRFGRITVEQITAHIDRTLSALYAPLPTPP